MKKFSTLIAVIILIICIFFTYFGINYYNKQKFETLESEESQVNTLQNIYENFFNKFKIYDSGNISLDDSCLTNIINNIPFNDANVQKLKELEKNNTENKFIHTLYLEYNKDTSILTLTLREKNGIQEYRIRYKLYVKGNTIKYETYGLVEALYMTPSK